MERFEIRKGGNLVRTYWDYNKKKNSGSYKEKDYTKVAARCLFENCTLDKDVTLKDVFLLLNRDIDFYKSVIGNWVEEFVSEGLKKSKYEANDIDTLVLKWDYQLSKDYDAKKGKTILEGMAIPGFYGTSRKNKDTYSVSFVSVDKLARLPLKLVEKVDIFDNRPEFFEKLKELPEDERGKEISPTFTADR